MAESYLVKPDTDFIRRIVDGGGQDVKKCYQCATCSVVCELSNGPNPFPRKEMVWAQWGLKDRLLADPDAWLCYQCNDCSTNCPRGARPGDVMAAVRRESVIHHAVPSFLGRLVSRPVFLPFLLAIPALLLGLAIRFQEAIGGALNVAAPGDGQTAYPIVYPYWNKLPHWLIICFFGFFSVLALLAAIAGVARFWRGMKAVDAQNGSTPRAKSLGSAIVAALKTVVGHNDFGTCTTERPRSLSHYFVFYGFLALSAVGLWMILLGATAHLGNPLLGRDFVYPFHFLNPWRVLANVGGLAAIVGCLMMMGERLRDRQGIGEGTYYDWSFLAAVLLVVLTGFLSEILHYARMEPHRQIVYFCHLTLVFALLMYLPYSKFAHMLYRTTAMVYAEYTGRNKPAVTAAAVDAAGDGQQEQEEPAATSE